MAKFEWCAMWGLCLLQLSLAQRIDLNITCRYAGVFHVEKNGRYSISRTEAADLCKAFNCTLPTMAQMEKARNVGFETCRYGFIEGHVVIPRIQPNAICAANNTGVYILTSNTSQYDTYCYNASAPEKEDCESITSLPNAFEGSISITIVNRDGTRYTQKGEYRTNPDDINNNSTAEEDITSGSSSERSTSESYIFHTHFPTAYPTEDQDSPPVSYFPEDTHNPITSTEHSNSHAAAQEHIPWIWSWFDNPQPKTQDQTTATTAQLLMQVTTTGTDSNIISAGWAPTEENEDERDKHPIHSGTGIDDDEDFISSTISTTPRVFDHSTQNRNWSQWNPGFLNPEVSLQTTTRMTDVDRSGTSDYGENWAPEDQSPLIHHEHHEEEETQLSTSTITPASAHDTHPNQRMTTPSQEDSSWTYFWDPISHPMGRGHQTERRMDMDSSHSTTLQPSADSNTGLVEDLDRTDPLPVTTQQSHTPSFSTSHGGLEEDKDQSMMSTPTYSNRHDGGGGNLPEDSATSVEGYTPHSPDTKEHTTLIPVTPANTESPGVTEVTVGDSNVNVDGHLPDEQDPSRRHPTTKGSDSTGHNRDSQAGGASTTSGPKRKPQIPEWLIILASLLALALILAVCIAVNSRRRCGQKKKLVINGNGAVEDRKPSGLNGEASKSQEMVHLVNKESSETPDQCMTADETRNLQNVDMKIGV